MSFITSRNAENIDSHTVEKKETVKPVEKIEAADAEQFADLIKKEEQELSKKEEVLPDETMSLEALQQQIRESLFKSGFNKAMEKAKEIRKELKDS